MAGRLAWIIAGGAAIIGGMAIQDGEMFSFGGDDRQFDREVDAAIDGAVAVREERGTPTIVVNGRPVSEDEAVRAMTGAVAGLVKAEAALAAAQIGSDEDPAEVAGAREQRDRARAEVERLKAALEAADGSSEARDAIRKQVRSEVREAIRNN